MDLLDKSFKQYPNAYGERKTRWSVVRNSYRQLDDTTKRTIEEWLPFAKWVASSNKFVIDVKQPDGTVVKSEWLLRALDKPEQIRNLLSLDLTGAWLNEAREIPKSIFEAIQGRTGRYPPRKEVESRWSGVIMDTNPPDPDNWMYKYFEEIRPHSCVRCKNPLGFPVVYDYDKGCPMCGKQDGIPYAVIYKQPSGRSPEAENLPNLEPNYYYNLMVGKDEDFIRVYVDGEYGYLREGKPVFPAFKDSVHVHKEPLEPMKSIGLVVGIDCSGLSPASVICQLDPRSRLLVLDEVYDPEVCMDIRTYIREMLKPTLLSPKYRFFDYVIVGDPAGNQRSQVDSRTVFQEMRANGLKNIRYASTNSLQPRLAAVNSFLTKRVGDTPGLILSPTCKMLRRGFAGDYKLRRLRVADERYSMIPDKNKASHVMDALQYACLGCENMFGANESMSPRRVATPPRVVPPSAWT